MEGIGVRPFAYLIPLLLGAYYVLVTDASSNSKVAVSVLLLVSVFALFAAPAYWIWAVLLQVLVGMHIAFHLTFKNR